MRFPSVTASYNVLDAQIELAQNYGMKDRQLRAAQRLIEGHQDGIRDAWRKHFSG